MDFPTFARHAVKPFGRMFDYSGRSPRKDFWPFVAFAYLLSQLPGAFTVIPFMVNVMANPEMIRPDLMVEQMMKPLIIGSLIWFAIIVLPFAAAITRRLHDVDRSGFWALPLAVTQTIGMGFSLWLLGNFATFTRGLEDGSIVGPFLILMAANLIFLAYWGVLIFFTARAGTPGPNRFGPPTDLPANPFL